MASERGAVCVFEYVDYEYAYAFTWAYNFLALLVMFRSEVQA